MIDALCVRQVIIGPNDMVDMRTPRDECLDAIHRAKKEFGDTDIYDIYEPICKRDSGCAGSHVASALSKCCLFPDGALASPLALGCKWGLGLRWKRMQCLAVSLR